MPGRNTNSGDYRYAYNGMETDNEVSGNGNSYTTEFRQYDPRLMRWKSLDPLMAEFPEISPYVAFNNNPVYFIDPYGLEGVNSTSDGDKPKKNKKFRRDRRNKRITTQRRLGRSRIPRNTNSTNKDNRNKKDRSKWKFELTWVHHDVEIKIYFERTQWVLGEPMRDVPVPERSSVVDRSINFYDEKIKILWDTHGRMQPPFKWPEPFINPDLNGNRATFIFSDKGKRIAPLLSLVYVPRGITGWKLPSLPHFGRTFRNGNGQVIAQISGGLNPNGNQDWFSYAILVRRLRPVIDINFTIHLGYPRLKIRRIPR